QEDAHRMRRHRHAERPAVGQMHQLGLRFDQRGEETELLPLEQAKIGKFRNPPAFAQTLQNLVERRVAGKPVLLDAPELGKRGVEEAEPLVHAVDRDRGMDVFEHLAMRVDVPREFALGAFEIGAIDRKADCAACAIGQFAVFDEPPAAAASAALPLCAAARACDASANHNTLSPLAVNAPWTLYSAPAGRLTLSVNGVPVARNFSTAALSRAASAGTSSARKLEYGDPPPLPGTEPTAFSALPSRRHHSAATGT